MTDFSLQIRFFIPELLGPAGRVDVNSLEEKHERSGLPWRPAGDWCHPDDLSVLIFVVPVNINIPDSFLSPTS